MKKLWLLTLIPAILALFYFGTLLGSENTTEPVKQPEITSTEANASYPSPDLNEIHQLVNAERAKAGAAPLTLHKNLELSAMDKCNDMIAKNYWSHNTPDGQKPWIFFYKYTGKEYTKLGENLAYGFRNSKDVVNGWMNSPTHKANMLYGFKYVGYASCKTEHLPVSGLTGWLIIQHFYL